MSKAIDGRTPWLGMTKALRGLGDAVSTPRGAAPDRAAAPAAARARRA